MNKYIIFHHNDLDGRAAAAIIYQYLMNNGIPLVKFQELDYKTPINWEEFSDNTSTFIVDYSFTEKTVEDLDKILKLSKKTVWLDHHKSSADLAAKYSYADENPSFEYIVDMNRSGALLALDWAKSKLPNFFNKYNDNWVYMVDDYDRWQHKNPLSMLFKLGMDCIDQYPTSGFWFELCINAKAIADIIYRGSIVKEYIDKQNYNNASKRYESVIDGHKCLVMNSVTKNSSVFLSDIEDYDCCVVWNYEGGVYSYSIYSHSNGADCEAIAKKFGGGGHIHAAGFITDELIVKPLKETHSRE